MITYSVYKYKNKGRVKVKIFGIPVLVKTFNDQGQASVWVAKRKERVKR